MPLPKKDRVIYDNNPLQLVICQLRFPAMLRLNAEEPIDFQERIRDIYPLYSMGAEISLIPKEIIDQMSPQMLAQLGATAIKSYEFVSSDKNWTLVLTRDYMALSTLKYIRWEDFRNHLSAPLQALIDLYSPSFFTRIGLRYQDLIQRSKLGLKKVKWAALLNKSLAGELADADISDGIEEKVSTILYRLDQYDAKAKVQHGLATVENSDEICYLIDTDLFLEGKCEVKDATNILGYFNERNRRIFQWCISKRLHEAMGPKLVQT
jgi:uncharacterized protein (TIGR04255 family)